MEHRVTGNERCLAVKYRPAVWALEFAGVLLIIGLFCFLILYGSIMKENTVKYNITFYIDGGICAKDKIQVQFEDDSDNKVTSQLAATEEGVYTTSKNAVLGMTVLNLKGNIKDFEAKLMHYNSNETDDIIVDWKINCIQEDGKWRAEHTVNCREGRNEYKVQDAFDAGEEQVVYLGP